MVPWFSAKAFDADGACVFQVRTVLAGLGADDLGVACRALRQFLAVMQAGAGSKVCSELSSTAVKRAVTEAIEAFVLARFKDGFAGEDVNAQSQALSLVLKIAKHLDVRSQAIERQIVFRSNTLRSLFHCLSDKYAALGDKSLLAEARQDQELFLLFLSVLDQRLIVIDDLEFQGFKQGAHSAAFLSLQQAQFAADLLNRVSFRVF